MADPVTLAVGSTVASLAGGGISAFGKFGQSQSQAAMYNYQAGMADVNAKIAAQNAEYAINSGQQSAAQYGMKLGQQIGATRVAQGASNIKVDSGSAGDVVGSERVVGGIDTANILNNAVRVAYGYQTQEVQQTEQAQLYRSAASDTNKAGVIGAIGSLVSGAGSVADKWLQMGQAFGSGGSGGDALDFGGVQKGFG